MKPATMKEAKARWSSHTKQVLNAIGRQRAAEKSVWSKEAGVPVVTIGDPPSDRFAFYVVGDHRHCFGQRLS